MRQPISPLTSCTIVQLSPRARNPMFAFCFLVVTEQRPWGVIGYVQGLGEGGKPGGLAYYRATWDEIEATGGVAVWAEGEGTDDAENKEGDTLVSDAPLPIDRLDDVQTTAVSKESPT